ncbi:MAG TPA: SpoIIE family protein phosphatase [Ignavibacteriaceae bacterium]|nr:SpoIIE family protein phosphatase [Ignavibacteriaceae bacterium]
MKKYPFGPFLILSLLLGSSFINGQVNDSLIQKDSTAITWTELDTTSTFTLNLNWKYQSGDDTTWAEKNYNDTSWMEINTQLYMDSLKEGTWQGYGWFRKEFKIDSTLFNKTVAFTVDQKGASEIYLNGMLIKKYGTFSKDPEKEELYNPQKIPFVVVLDASPVQILAFRYSNHQAKEFAERYKGPAQNAGFTIRIGEPDKLIEQSVSSEFLSSLILVILAGILIAFSVLHMLIYFFYSRGKENLFYALFAGSMAMFFAVALFSNHTHSVSDFTYILESSIIIFIAIMFASYNFFLYAIFYDKMPKKSWIIVIVGALLSIMLLFFYSADWMFNYVFGPFLLLLTVEGVRVIILAIKRKKRNSVIIGIGVLVFFLFIIYIPISNIFSLRLPGWFNLVFVYSGFLSLPISMSIYLARDSAKTKTDLENRIIEVQELSDKAIEQERREAELRIEREKEKVENERKTKELEEARQMQLSMLPKEIPHFTNLEIATYTKPATEVGGDYYDFMKSEDGTLTLIVGDATGHGLKAGTMVTATKSLFNSLASRKNIVEILKEFNNSLYKMKLYNLAMCLSILKIKDNKLEIASAGMPPALIYRKATGKVDEILLKGMSLGSIKAFPYYKESYELNHGDLILLMSDGFPERFTAEREMIDYEKGNEILAKIGTRSPNEIIDHFVKYGDEWAKGHPQEDDVTFVAVKIK